MLDWAECPQEVMTMNSVSLTGLGWRQVTESQDGSTHRWRWNHLLLGLVGTVTEPKEFPCTPSPILVFPPT